MKSLNKSVPEEFSTLEKSADQKKEREVVPYVRGNLKKFPNGGYRYFIICLAIIVAVSVLYILALNLNSACITVSMSFSEISKGQNPDGSPFDIYEVICDEVLEMTCEKLDNKIDAETLKKHISVSGITSDGSFNAIEQNIYDGHDTYSYFPPRYTITYSVISDSVRADGIIASISAVFKQLKTPSKTKVLESIAESYKEYYEDNYVVTRDSFNVNRDAVDSLDYFNRADEMQTILNRMTRFLEKRYEEDVRFVSCDGTSFGDLCSEAARIVENDIESYRAFIIQNGITKDRDKLLKQFRYVSKTNREQTLRNRGEYAVMLDGISIYDPAVTKVVFIPSLDSANDFYMNRTKIGIDYLTENARNANLAGDETENKANYYEYLAGQFSSVQNSEEHVMRFADEKYCEIMSKINDFARKAADVNYEYVKNVSYDGISVGGTSYGQGIVTSVVAVVKISIIWASFLYILYLAYGGLILRKKRKNLNVNKGIN